MYFMRGIQFQAQFCNIFCEDLDAMLNNMRVEVAASCGIAESKDKAFLSTTITLDLLISLPLASLLFLRVWAK